MAEVLGTDPGEGISAQGMTLQGSVSGAIGMIDNLNINGWEVREADVTTMNSGGWEQVIATIRSAREMSLGLLYEPTNMALLAAAFGVEQVFTITFPDDAQLVVSGFVKSLGVQAPKDDKIQQPCTVRFKGRPVFYEPS